MFILNKYNCNIYLIYNTYNIFNIKVGIRMTDEEMAEEYRKSLKQKLIDEDEFERLEMFDENVEEAYLAGLKAARQKMWHDLREKPDDFPEDCAINQDGKRVLYDHINKVWRNDDADEYICDDPIAWCEIPKYTNK